MYFFVTSQRSRDPGRPHSRLPPLHHQSFHPSHRLIRLRDGPSHPHTRAGLRPVCVPPLAGNVRQTSTIFSCQLWSHDPRVKEDQIVADEVGPWCRRYLNVQRRVQSVCHSDQTAEVRKTNVESVSLQCPLLSLMTCLFPHSVRRVGNYYLPLQESGGIYGHRLNVTVTQ